MNNLTTYNNGLSINKTTDPTKTENGTKIVMPGKEADKDLFLKMLVAQMSNQDPFNPQDPTQYVTQLSQFTMLEQVMDFNDGMKNLLGMTNGLIINSAMNTATSLIGKSVEVYAPAESSEGLTTEGDNTEEANKETLTGVVESIHAKDGIVYMDVRIDKTGELKSIEYSSLIKVSENNINIDNKGE